MKRKPMVFGKVVNGVPSLRAEENHDFVSLKSVASRVELYKAVYGLRSLFRRIVALNK